MINAIQDLFSTFGKLIANHVDVVLIIAGLLIIIGCLIKDAHNSR